VSTWSICRKIGQINEKKNKIILVIGFIFAGSTVLDVFAAAVMGSLQ